VVYAPRVAGGFAGFAGADSIAVVGASPRNVIARITLENLRRWRFPGRVFGLHPSAAEVDGVPTFASWDDSGSADLALLAVGAPRLVEAIDAGAAAGVRRFVIPGAGANEGGRAVEADLRQAVSRARAEVIGPNCMGFASLPGRVIAYVGTLDPDLQPGRVGLVSQSGSVCELFTAMPWRIGFSHVVSVGNELGVDLTAVLEFLVDDEATEVIGLFVEGVRRPEEFRRALVRAADEGKPVVALKVGRSDAAREGTVAHTGALAGDAEAFSAVLRDAGSIEAGDLDEMQNTLELLGKGLRRPPGRVLYAGDSGGQANLFADLAEKHGIDLPPLAPDAAAALRDRFPMLGDDANPLDLWALDRPEAIYRDAVPILVERQPDLVVLGLDKFLARTEAEVAFVRTGVEAVPEPGTVVLMAFGGSEQADDVVLRTCWERGVPVVRGAERTLTALAAIGRWERWRAHSSRTPPPPVRADLPAGGPWTERAAKELLAAAGIPVPREREVRTVDEAVAAAVDIGFPVVAKVAGEGIAHKTELGGVRLGLTDGDLVRAAAVELLRLGPAVLIAEQRRADVELIASGFADDQFGPCGLLGLGGVWTEALGRSVVVAGPGSEETVRRALGSTSWGRLLLEGARGRRLAVDAVTDCCLRLIAIVAGTGLRTVEINPLFVNGQGVVAVDALVVPATSGPTGTAPAARTAPPAETGGSGTA
jgi:acetate---CoA ligase (ADP-forming)